MLKHGKNAQQLDRERQQVVVEPSVALLEVVWRSWDIQ